MQVYRNDDKSFIKELEKPVVKSAMSKIPVSIGIYTGNLRNPVEMKTINNRVKIVRKHKLSGVSFFYWESLWGYITPESPQKRRDGFLEIFSQPNVKPMKLKKKV